MKFVIFALLFFCTYSVASSQLVGNFQLDIEFNEPDYNFTRTLYYHIPEDYNAFKSYKLVVGLRGGPHSNAGEFRNQLQFLADSIEAIIVCPENKDHFWNQEELTKQLCKYTVDKTVSMYNIDPDYIYLTGLSYGGRHAVIVSMDTDSGPIENIRGVIPFATGSEADIQPNYEDIEDFPPACICIGLLDSQNFKNVANNIHTDITANGGISYLNEIEGVGHTTNFPTYADEMMECINFIEDYYKSLSTIENNDEAFLVEIFPNPADQHLKINTDENIEVKEISIYDVTGNLMLKDYTTPKSIDTSKWPKGMYSILIKTTDHSITKKVFIRH